MNGSYHIQYIIFYFKIITERERERERDHIWRIRNVSYPLYILEQLAKFQYYCQKGVSDPQRVVFRL